MFNLRINTQNQKRNGSIATSGEGPFAGHSAASEVSRLAWLMWISVVIWALIYDTMYAMADREDDVRIGVNSTAILFGQADVFIISVLQVVLLLALLLVGEVAFLGMWYRLSWPSRPSWKSSDHSSVTDGVPTVGLPQVNSRGPSNHRATGRAAAQHTALRHPDQ